jgi:DNA repair exonuclease SbcCD ATPase subunit
MSYKIIKLELENVKRVRAVEITPAAVGLTTIGGKNCQGKTSILDAITYALGGEKYRPSNLQREGSTAEASIRITMSNGLVVERSGKNASLKVIDPSGARAGQRLLDSFVEELALNLPKFMAMNPAEKAKVLLSILGIEDQLKAIDAEEKAAYDERTMQGRIADQKEKYAAEMPEWHDVPEEPVTPAALVAESQSIMARNAAKANARANLAQMAQAEKAAWEKAKAKDQRIAEIKAMLSQAEKEYSDALTAAKNIHDEIEQARAIPIDADESTSEIERKLAELEAINGKVRANSDKQKAIDDAENARQAYNVLTARVEEVRAKRRKLLESVKLPLPGLGVENGELVFCGQKWDCMSGMEQIKVAAAIIRQRKPECGFILLDKLEAFDMEQLQILSDWLKAENLQAIATRVSTGEECSIIIEDGLVVAAQNDDQELDW